MFDFDPVYLFYLLIGISAAMFAEGAYLLFYNQSSYRKNINRRLKVMDNKSDRESVLVQLRRERGLNSAQELNGARVLAPSSVRMARRPARKPPMSSINRLRSPVRACTASRVSSCRASSTARRPAPGCSRRPCT